MIKILFTLLLFPMLVSCATPFARYRTDAPWSEVETPYTFDIVDATYYWDGRFHEYPMNAFISPAANAIGLYHDNSPFYEYQLEFFEVDFEIIIEHLSKFEEWYHQAHDMQATLTRRIAFVQLPVYYLWSTRTDWHKSLVRVELTFVTIGDGEYRLEWNMENISPYYEARGVGTISQIRFFTDLETTRRIASFMEPATIDHLVVLAEKNQADIDAREAEEAEAARRQQEIEETFR